MFHKGGRVPKDTPETAAARQEQSNIQRRHRTERRHGEDPSQTPTIDNLIREPNPNTTPRRGRPPKPRPEANHNAPPPHRGRPPLPESEPHQDDSAHINLNGNRRRRRSAGSLDTGRPRGRPRLSSPEPAPRNLSRSHPAQRVEPRPFNEPLPEFRGNAQECPLSEEDLRTKRRFDESLAAKLMVECLRCKEKWLDIKLKGDGVCVRYHTKDDKKRADAPFLYSAENKLDFGDVPAFLPQLELLEELLIARVYLRFLAANHPGYREFQFDEGNLLQLPEDDCVFDSLIIQEVEDLGGISADAGLNAEIPKEDDVCDEAAVLNVLINTSELS
ncbi:hypothetical protein F4804DRAFT_335965 [Jackrogersella minutella]|nr:hypothetical protein F4804DRAFT_335965 [Jackrogersella minutella]